MLDSNSIQIIIFIFILLQYLQGFFNLLQGQFFHNYFIKNIYILQSESCDHVINIKRLHQELITALQHRRIHVSDIIIVIY